MLQNPMTGTAKEKRQAWIRKKGFGQELKNSIKRQKKTFKRELRNGKEKSIELPRKGNSYRKAANSNAKWEFVS